MPEVITSANLAPPQVRDVTENLARTGMAFVPFLTPARSGRHEKQFAAVVTPDGRRALPLFLDQGAGRARLGVTSGYHLEFLAHNLATIQEELIPILERLGLLVTLHGDGRDFHLAPDALRQLLAGTTGDSLAS